MRAALAEYLHTFLFSLLDFSHRLRGGHVLDVERTAGDLRIIAVGSDMPRLAKRGRPIVPSARILSPLFKEILLNHSRDLPVFAMKGIDGGRAETGYVSHRGIHRSVVITENSLLPAPDPGVPNGCTRS